MHGTAHTVLDSFAPYREMVTRCQRCRSEVLLSTDLDLDKDSGLAVVLESGLEVDVDVDVDVGVPTSVKRGVCGGGRAEYTLLHQIRPDQTRPDRTRIDCRANLNRSRWKKVL